MSSLKPLLRALVIPVLALLLGAAGVVIGVLIGGNIPSSTQHCMLVEGVATCVESSAFTYRGLGGYEAGGMLGFHLGLALGAVLGVLLWRFLRARAARHGAYPYGA